MRCRTAVMRGYFLGFEFLDYVELMSACPPIAAHRMRCSALAARSLFMLCLAVCDEFTFAEPTKSSFRGGS